MIYGDLGAGVLQWRAVYAFGGGVELAMTDQLSVRGDLQGIGAVRRHPDDRQGHGRPSLAPQLTPIHARSDSCRTAPSRGAVFRSYCRS